MPYQQWLNSRYAYKHRIFEISIKLFEFGLYTTFFSDINKD